MADLNLGALCAVVAAGAGLTAQEEKALPERVFRAGIANVAVPATDYLVTLMNPSGREIEEGEGEPGKP